MKISTFFLITIILLMNSSINHGQVPDSVSIKQALGQTKGMKLFLSMDDSLSAKVYQVNLKYQLKTDSLRASTTSSQNKRQMHSMILQAKLKELKNILPTEKYNKFLISIGKEEEITL